MLRTKSERETLRKLGASHVIENFLDYEHCLQCLEGAAVPDAEASKPRQWTRRRFGAGALAAVPSLRSARVIAKIIRAKTKDNEWN